MDSTLTITLFVAGTILTVFGFFLKTAYNDARKDLDLLFENDHKRSEELGKLKGKIELVEQEARLKYQAIQEQTQLEIKNLARSVGDLTDTVKQLITKGVFGQLGDYGPIGLAVLALGYVAWIFIKRHLAEKDRLKEELLADKKKKRTSKSK
jgi:hypothetical protein